MAKGDEVLRNVESTVGTTRFLRVSSGGVSAQLTSSQDLSAGILDYTSSVGSDFLLNGVFFTFDGVTTQDVSLEYNGVVIFSQTASNVTTAFIDAGSYKILGSLSKELTIKCTNTGTPAIEVSIIADIEVV